MNEVDAVSIPVDVHGVEGEDPVLSVLTEIRHALDRLTGLGEPTVIALGDTPFHPGDEGRLLATLGEGDIAVRLRGSEDWRVSATRLPGVWVVEQRDADGMRITFRIEVVELPDLLRPRPAAIADSAARLGQALETGSMAVREGGAMWARVPVLGLAAYSGTGKTTLLRRLIPLLRGRGLRLGLVKHAHHDFDPDIPGKDSYELRKAGAGQVLVASDTRWALINENDPVGDQTLQSLLDRFDQRRLDLLLVEGFKHLPFPKIELHRPAVGKPLLYPHDRNIIAVATDAALPEVPPLPVLDLNDPEALAGFIVRWWEGAKG